MHDLERAAGISDERMGERHQQEQDRRAAAYPRLIEALQSAKKTLVFIGGDDRGTLQYAETVRIDAILAELGEKIEKE